MKKLIWIASYPKSGNTFLRAMLSSFFFSKNGHFEQKFLSNIPEFPRDFFEYKKNNDFFKEINLWADKQKEIVRNNQNFKILKTHSANLTINNSIYSINPLSSLCAIYIVRDPRNVILSLKNQYQIDTNASLKFLLNKKNFLKLEKNNLSKGYVPILDWGNNYLSWKKQNFVETLFIKYEDLVNKQKQTFYEILNFLNKFINVRDIDNTYKINNVILTTKFKNLRRIEEKEGFIEKDIMGISKNKNFFFNKGASQNFKKNLDTKIINKIEYEYKDLLKNLNYKDLE